MGRERAVGRRRSLSFPLPRPTSSSVLATRSPAGAWQRQPPSQCSSDGSSADGDPRISGGGGSTGSTAAVESTAAIFSEN